MRTSRPPWRGIFAQDAFGRLVEAFREAMRTGRRIYFTGCGATGRLSILLEAAWRRFWREEGARGPRRPPACRTSASASWPAGTSPSSSPWKGSKIFPISAGTSCRRRAFSGTTSWSPSPRAARRRSSSAPPGRVSTPGPTCSSSTTTPATCCAGTCSGRGRSSKSRASASWTWRPARWPSPARPACRPPRRNSSSSGPLSKRRCAFLQESP